MQKNTTEYKRMKTTESKIKTIICTNNILFLVRWYLPVRQKAENKSCHFVSDFWLMFDCYDRNDNSHNQTEKEDFFNESIYPIQFGIDIRKRKSFV